MHPAKRFAVLMVTAFFLSTPALAASPIESLFSPLLNIGNQICNAQNNNALLSTLNIANFCQTIQLAQRGFKIEQLLTDVGTKLLNNALNGAIQGLGDTLNKTVLNGVDQWFGKVNEQVLQVLSLPETLIDLIARQAYQTAYSAMTTTSLSIEKPDPGLNLSIAVAEGTSDSVTQDIKKYNESLEKGIKPGIQDNLEAVGKMVAYQQQNEEAERAAQIAQENAQETLLNQQISKQTKKAAEVATAGAQVTAPLDEKGGGIAEQYKRLAENAPSDRALLELNVKALADLMSQQATYMPAIADLLVEQSKVQVMTTNMLQAQTNQAARQLTGTQDPNAMANQLKREIKAIEQENLNTMSPTLAALDAMICIYSGYSEFCDTAQTTTSKTDSGTGK